MFDHPSFDDHERVVLINDAASGLKAIIAVHSLARGPALGGCRMRPYETADAALADALELSKAMSYKNALGDRPFGGAKAVILGDPASQKTRGLLQAFGAAVDRLGGDYITAEDAGITPDDIQTIAKRTDHVRNIDYAFGGPAPYTAYGVFIGIRTALEVVHGKSLAGRTVSIQGLGGVGYGLCNWLSKAGARLVVSDIDPTRVQAAVGEFGATAVDSSEAHRVPADVFAPCAFGGILNVETISQMQADIVAGGANNQLATERDRERLLKRGIVYCPDYVINAGGIRSTEKPGVSFNHEAAMSRVEGIADVLSAIIEVARKSRQSPSVVADDMARALIGRRRIRTESEEIEELLEREA